MLIGIVALVIVAAIGVLMFALCNASSDWRDDEWR